MLDWLLLGTLGAVLLVVMVEVGHVLLVALSAARRQQATKNGKSEDDPSWRAGMR